MKDGRREERAEVRAALEAHAASQKAELRGLRIGGVEPKYIRRAGH